MNSIIRILIAGLLAAFAIQAGSKEVKTINIGNAAVVYDFITTETEVKILTLNALISETNDSLRGLKNTDRSRLNKLGQLIYQCRLMLYQSPAGDTVLSESDPMLIAKNYSLYSGVDLDLSANERMGLRVQALRTVDDASLFTTALGSGNQQQGLWQTSRAGVAFNLRQFDVTVLQESDVIETSENLDIIVRFPVYQVEKPVREWSYNFDIRDFKQAVKHVDENCTPKIFAGWYKTEG